MNINLVDLINLRDEIIDSLVTDAIDQYAIKDNVQIDRKKYYTECDQYSKARRKYLTDWINTNLSTMFDVKGNTYQLKVAIDIVKQNMVYNTSYGLHKISVEEELNWLLICYGHNPYDIKLIKNDKYVAPKFDTPIPQKPPYYGYELFVLET